jgi:soluble lytic murein transglycosylase
MDTDQNLRAGIRFLKSLIKKHDGQIELALAAYNAGPMHVTDWLRRYPAQDMSLFVELIPFKETRDYVTSILRNVYWYKRLYDVPAEGESSPTLHSSMKGFESIQM